MGTRLYVGNLPYSVRDAELADLFTPFGSVAEAQVIIDKATNRSKGFGFVTMGTEDEARVAIEALHGKESLGRTLTVNEAKPREARPAGAGGGGHRF